tara:strand:- start:1143 stop:1817 length:675 start_codon:yes stop_codon:yes gene_type:complete
MENKKNFDLIKKKIIWTDPFLLRFFSAPPNWWWYARLEKRIKNIKIKKLLENFAMGDLYYNGNWDLSATLFTNSDWSKKIRMLAPNYKNYKSSSWYQSIIYQINQEGLYKHKKINIKNEIEAGSFFESYIGGMVESLSRNGYIIEDENSNDIPKVLISRNGNLIKSGNGCHRLAVIQEFNLKCRYPIQIIGIHKKLNINGKNASLLDLSEVDSFIVDKFSKHTS